MTMITFLCSSIYFKIRSFSATTLRVSFYHNDMQLKITKKPTKKQKKTTKKQTNKKKNNNKKQQQQQQKTKQNKNKYIYFYLIISGRCKMFSECPTGSGRTP